MPAITENAWMDPSVSDMELQHVNIKIFVAGDLTVDSTRFIEIFHRWIREKGLDGFLIDLADYRHVQSVPAVMLIGLAGDDATANEGDGRYAKEAAPLEPLLDSQIRPVARMFHG